jgi:murein L,D-transpeptidase YcbB/YkuD
VIVLACAVAARAEAPFGHAAAVAGELSAAATDARFARDAAALQAFYAARGDRPAWFDAVGAPVAAGAASAVLDQAAHHGLDPRDYAVDLRPRPGVPVADDVARRDVALSAALFRMLEDVHSGRVPPQSLHPALALGERRADLAALVAASLAEGTVASLPARLAPQLASYARLVVALDRYRALAALGDGPPLPVLAKLEPGGRYAATAQLAGRLRVLGDLQGELAPGPRYEGALVAAVKRFQARHGLAADGVPGPATFAALNVPLAARVAQIELAMERLRWLPPFPPQPVIVVDIPAFRLWAFDGPDDHRPPVLAMDVIVGNAMDTRTPVFADTLRAIELNPYWNVPTSIAAKEIVPRLRRDPDHFAREGFEVVGDGGVRTTLDPTMLAALEAGSLRLRQRPGPRNPMGSIKFVLPNNLAIFLHDTSSPRLFARGRRDLSHGCIRVADPVGLARFALEGTEWDETRIRAAMQAGTPSRARLARPITVLVFYATAYADASGAVHFLTDIYGHDRTLAEALAGRRR